MKRAYFENLAPVWDTLPAPPDSPQRMARVMDKAVLGSERMVLDVGSGTGILLPELRRRLPSALLVECDFAHAMLAAARNRGTASPVGFVCADAAHPPFREALFDLVLCFNAVPHFPDLPAALKALTSTLRSGGRLVIGHIMGSPQLNALHAQIGGAVGSDVLPAASDVANVFATLGLQSCSADESPEHYFVAGTR